MVINMGLFGCKNWEPKKCVRCGAAWGMSDCFERIDFASKEEAEAFYKSKGGKGASEPMKV